MLLMVGIVVGAFYWNAQLSFGVKLPSNFPHCLGVADAPDRGSYILLSRHAKCPDLKKESLFDYVERKGIPSVGIIAWYNTIEGFDSSLELAANYCPKKSIIHKKNMNYGVVHYCFISHGRRESLLGFVQVHKSAAGREAVNIEFILNETQDEYIREYWRIVESLVLSRPFLE